MTRTDEAATVAATVAIPLAAMASRNGSASASGQSGCEAAEPDATAYVALLELRRLAQ